MKRTNVAYDELNKAYTHPRRTSLFPGPVPRVWIASDCWGP